MKSILYGLCLLFMGCGEEKMLVERAMNGITLLNTPSNYVYAQQVPALVSYEDTLFLISQISPYFQNYDSVVIQRVKPNLPISGTTYSVTNDSAVYVLAFFSPTVQDYGHNIFLNNNYSVGEIAR